MNNLHPEIRVDKNGKPVTRHVKNDAKPKKNRVAVATPAPVADTLTNLELITPREVNNAEIESVIESGVANGVLEPTRSVMGDRAYEVRDRYLGETKQGYKVYVSMEVEHGSDKRRLDNLSGYSEDSWGFSMSGRLVEPDGGGMGQISHMLSQITKPAAGVSKKEIDFIEYFWRNHHLNAMQSGTEKQRAQYRAILEAEYPNVSHAEAAARVDDDRGYEYGSDWLFADVPADDFRDVVGILGKLKKSGF